MTGPEPSGAGAAGAGGPAGIEALVRRLVADLAGVAPQDIEAGRPLVEYGLSSRDAVGVTGELEGALGRSLPATLLWDNPTLAEVVRHLVEGTAERAESERSDRSDRSDRSPGGGDPVAVVGIGCRLPGGVGGPDAFWDLLLRNGDTVGEVPEERWKDWGEDRAAAALPPVVRRGSFLDDVTAFDAQFFGITPSEAHLMDPQQRLLLEVACEALDHAGMPAPTLQGSPTGVYVGLSSLEYGLLTTADLSRVTEWTSTGAAGSIAANRVSYALDLRGPSMMVDTACSSSLVALHQACRGLRSGECDTALAAGVNVLLSPSVTAGFDRAGVLAPGGRCRSFDAGAEGIVRGEGCGVVVLKRLSDAQRDGDLILALVRGTAVNSDGRSAGLVAPNPVAQQALLRAALRDAGVDGAEVDYVETHGTGTLLGDPIEAGALSAVMGRGRPADRPLLIGAVKSNLGHLEGAAGVTGVIKTVLSLHHGRLPASLHFRKPNPHIDFTGGRLRVVSESAEWPADGHRPARAGVSAFGFGGTNAHAVLEEWRPRDRRRHGAAPPARSQAPAPTATVPHVLVVSARTPDRLADAANGLADWLTGPAGLRTPLDDLTHTLGNNRYGPVCAAVVGRDRDALAAGLGALGRERAAKDVVGPRPPIGPADAPAAGPVFVFSGYGTQWAGMGRRLLADDDAFATAVHELDPVFDAEAGTPLSRLIGDGVPLTAVARVQPLLYGLQLALTRTWRSYGVEPAAVIGHSMGEVAAAVAAGVLDPADGLRLVLRRSDLLASVTGDRTGAMAAVELPADERARTLARFPGVEVAVDTSPRRCTVSGPPDAVGALVAALEADGVQARTLDVGGAGHSSAVDPVLPALRAAFADIRGRSPAIRWYGTVHDDPRRDPAADADYWCDNARRPVRFRQAVAAAASDGHRAFLEISPHPVAGLPVGETLAEAVDGPTLVLPTLLRDSDEPVALRTSLAALHTAGVQRRPDLLWPTGRRTSLPTTPWRHARYWTEGAGRGRPATPGHPLLGTRSDVPGTHQAVWRGDAGTDGRGSVDRRVHGTPVLTLAACAEMVLAAAVEVFGTAVENVVVRDLALDRLLPLSGSTPVVTLLDRGTPGRAAVSVHTRSDAGTWTRHAAATVELGEAEGSDDATHVPCERAEPADVRAVDVPASLVADGPRTPWQFGPELLDACLRAPAGAGAATDTPEDDALPVAVARLRVRRPAGTAARCRVRPEAPADSHEADSHEAAPPGWSVRLADAAGTALLAADGVVLRVPEHRELPLPLGEQAYEIAWEPTPPPPVRSTAPSDWLLLTFGPGPDGRRRDGHGAALCAALRDRKVRVTFAHCGEEDPGRTVAAWRESLADGARAATVLLCTEPADATGARETVLTAAATARCLAEAGGSAGPPRLFLVTANATAVAEAEEGDPDRACLRGLLRVLALEHPDLRPCLIDVDGLSGVADLAGELLAGGDDDDVAWRAGTRFAARLSRTDPAAAGKPDAVPFARPGGAYIVTGGLGGLGLATARRLAERGAGRLVLNGRRAPGPEAEGVLGELRALGTEVEVVRGDIAEPGTAPQLVAAAERHGHRLRGVAHAAGVLRDGVIGGLQPGDLDLVFRPKADGARHLDAATAGRPLDWWLAFSSAAALFGSPGQAAYAAANAWLDALVQRRRARGAVGQSIAWGPWAGTGGAPDMSLLAVEPIALDDGLDALQTIVGGGRSHTGVVRLDADRVVRAFPGIELVPFFTGLVRGGADDKPDEGFGVGELGRLDADAALAAVRRRLTVRLATIMGYAEDEIDAGVPLTDLGLDSLMAVRLRNAVTQDFQVALPESLLLRGGTLDEVAAALLASLGTHAGARAPAPSPAPASRAEATDGVVERDEATAEATDATAPPVPKEVLPRDAAERLVAGVWAQVAGQPAEGVLLELTAVRDDPARSAAFAEAIRTRLGGAGAAPTAGQIRRNPTVAAVADLVRPVMEGRADGSALRVLRESGPGTGPAPLFVFHPAGGSTSVYRPLTDRLPADQPVLGLDRVESLTSVEDKTEHYLGLMRRVQPEGPYRLLGWSFGGCLAYEAAVRLRERGEDVGYLGLIDTILPAALPGPPPEELLMQRFARFADYVGTAYGRQLDLPYREMAAQDEEQQVETLMRHLADAGLDMSPGVLEHQRTSYLDARVGERYRPRPYPGRVVLYRATRAQALTTAIDPRYLRDDEDLGWAPLCPDLEVVPVSGDHLSLIDPPHVEVITGHLRTALSDRV